MVHSTHKHLLSTVILAGATALLCSTGFMGCNSDAPPPAPYLPPSIIFIDDRSGTTEEHGIKHPDTAFYADIARALQDNCPGGELAVILCGNPRPEAGSSIRFDADTAEFITLGDDANHEERLAARLKNEARAERLQKAVSDFKFLLDSLVIRYQPRDGKDVTFLDSALLRARQILDADIRSGQPKMLVNITDGWNENQAGERIPFARPFVRPSDTTGLEILLNSWENPDTSIFQGPALLHPTIESLPDTKKQLLQFIRSHRRRK